MPGFCKTTRCALTDGALWLDAELPLRRPAAPPLSPLLPRRHPPAAAPEYANTRHQVAIRCDHCGRVCDPPLRCGRCKLARYCSAEHQRAAWGGGHRDECAALCACAPRVPPPTVRMLARALWRAARERRQGAAQPCGAEGGGAFADVEALQHHWGALDGGRKVAYAQMAGLARCVGGFGVGVFRGGEGKGSEPSGEHTLQHRPPPRHRPQRVHARGRQQ
jgi:hypothetical protein